MNQEIKILIIVVIVMVCINFLLISFNLSPFRFIKIVFSKIKFTSKSRLSNSEKKQIALKLSEATRELSASKTGAIIVIERIDSLNDYINLGVLINSDITIQLIIAIFSKHSPIHDGAIIVRGTKMICTSAYLPSTKKKISSAYGSRHRAGIGISEITDAFTIIVSETNGAISYTYKGEMIHVNSSIDLVNIVYKHLSVSDSGNH